MFFIPSLGTSIIFFSRSVNFSSSYGILKNTVADVSIVLKSFKTIFRKKFGLKMLAEVNNEGLIQLLKESN